MSAFYPTFFSNYLLGHLTAMNPAPVKLVLFRQAPAFSNDDARYLGINSVTTLGQQLGWTAPITPSSVSMTVGTRVQGGANYVIASNPFDLPPAFPDSTVMAAALVYDGLLGGVTDPIIFVTNTPFTGAPIIRDTDSITPRPDTTLGVSSNQWLFNWITPQGGATTLPLFEGPLAILRGPPDFEAAHTLHSWLYPQRVNLLANPSFEGGTNHWKANGTMTRPNVGAPGGGFWSLNVAGTIAESNTFPVTVGKGGTKFTLQGMIGGTGKMRLGLCSWRSQYDFLFTDWGTDDEVWTLPGGSSYLHIEALRQAYDSSGYAFVRVQCDGGQLVLDNMLCEPGWQTAWMYFDGDTKYGARDDFSWYGGSNRQGASYSCWYNARRAVVGRLFAWNLTDTDPTITDTEVEAQGLVYRWCPAGTRVTPHLDVLWPNDLQAQPPDVSGSVTPYVVPGTPGVANPWAKTQYLQPTVGTATTPDPGVPPGLCTWVFKVRGPVGTDAFYMLAGQYETSGQYAWYIRRSVWVPGQMVLTIYQDGVSQVNTQQAQQSAASGVEEWIAVTRNDNGSTYTVQSHRSTDGVNWTVTGTSTSTTSRVCFDSNSVVRIGAVTGTGNTWNDRIYSAELRTGLDPKAGTVLWRFDATEAPPGQTSYTDPRGRVWTLSSAAAIKH